MLFCFDLQGTRVNIIVGSHVWVFDPEIAWLDGQVLKINGQEVEIQASNGKRVGARLSLLASSMLFDYLLESLDKSYMKGKTLVEIPTTK